VLIMSMTRREILSSAAVLPLAGMLSAQTHDKKILVVVGPTDHPPGTHEVAAGGRLLAFCLEKAGLKADVISEWPRERPPGYSSVVFIGDMFPAEKMTPRDRIMADLTAMMKAGCGMVCIHYATGLEAKHVSATGDHPLLEWIGGYFATRCTHHQSVAKVFAQATVEPDAKDHPINRGWTKFDFHDEPYIKNYFGPKGMTKNVTSFAMAMLPPEKPEKQTVGWATERTDGGRGVGIVFPHFYRNWKLDTMRTLILNAIVWSAGSDVPKDGVVVKLPNLTDFKPASVEPVPRKP
jgi:type 1 glutamine amidotransferase